MDNRSSERKPRPTGSVIAATVISPSLLRTAPNRPSRNPAAADRTVRRKPSATKAAPAAGPSAGSQAAARDSSVDLVVSPADLAPEGLVETAPLPAGTPEVKTPAAQPPSANSLGCVAVHSTAPCDEIGDDVLVHQAQAGSATAFKLLIERHQRAVYGYFRARVLDASDAEDLCQEVFLRCYQMPATFESPMMVRPWLMGISRNVLREHVRRLSRRKEVAWTELCLEVDASTPAADDRYDEVIRVLPGCLEALGSSAREALDLYYRSKLRLAQIGEKLRRSEGAVKLLMYRARQSLKNCLMRKTGCPIQE
jgi:RNA polymerase sigma-70 factor (ECF subfamily)